MEQAERENERLRRENERLRRELKAAGQESKRGKPKAKTAPRRPGRKAGQGPFTFRQAPARPVIAGRSSPLSSGLGRTFFVDQHPLSLNPPFVSAERARAANDSVTGNDQGQAICGASASHSPGG